MYGNRFYCRIQVRWIETPQKTSYFKGHVSQSLKKAIKGEFRVQHKLGSN